jgi:hypothetical protein
VVHDEARRAEDTDWREILALYGMLKCLSDNPMVTLNHAIATAMVHGPKAGLDLLAPLDSDERLRAHYRLDACAPISSSGPTIAKPRSRSIAQLRKRRPGSRNGTTC